MADGDSCLLAVRCCGPIGTNEAHDLGLQGWRYVWREFDACEGLRCEWVRSNACRLALTRVPCHSPLILNSQALTPNPSRETCMLKRVDTIIGGCLTAPTRVGANGGTNKAGP